MPGSSGIQPTVKPLLRVVHSVFAPWLTGVAKLLVSGWMDLRAARVRRLCFRLRARRCEAIEEKESKGVGGGVNGSGQVQYAESFDDARLKLPLRSEDVAVRNQGTAFVLQLQCS